MRNNYFKERHMWIFYLVWILYLHLTAAKEACDKYKHEPRSAWPKLPKQCQEFLRNQLEVSKDYTTTQITDVTSRVVSPLNFGEREVEIEKEFSNNKKEVEIEVEIESESDFEGDRIRCSGTDCQKDSKTGSDRTDEGAQSAGLHLELLRTIAVIFMSAVAALTIIVLATAICCVMKRRAARDIQEERKEPARRNDHQRYHGSPSLGNVPINKSQNNQPDGQRSFVEYHEATPVTGRRHNPAMRTTPTRSEPGYNLVNETQYACIDDDVVSLKTESGKGHYYFKLDSEAASKSSAKSHGRWSPANARPPNSHQSATASSRTLLTSLGTPPRGSPSTGSVLTTGSQYDHLDHSSNSHRTTSKSTSKSTRYDVLDLK